MTALEKRTVERSNNILVVTLRQGGNSHDYLLGITNNCSHKGINVETGRLEYGPGEVLELRLKHPYSECSIEVVGEIVWKTEGWYKSITGIKLREMDQDTDNQMKTLMSHTIHVDDSPPSLNRDVRLSKATEKEEALIPEPATNAEIIISHEDTSSIPKEEVSFPAEEKAFVNVHTYRKENASVKILKKTGLSLIVFCVLFTFVTVTTRVISSENDTKTKLPGLSQSPTLVQGLPVDKGNSGSDPDQYVMSPVPVPGIRSGHKAKAEKADLSKQTTAIQEQPVLRKEITFDRNSDIISPIYHPGIDTFVKELLSRSDAVLMVEGYADRIGAELYNLDLAMRRAWEVKKLFVKRGINDKRIKVTVYGESYPVSSNNDESENPRDRRVDLLLIPYSGRI